jgi:predicted RecA/RadA family phage recombinase
MAETGLKLRTACPNGDWRSFIVTAPSGGVTAGQMDLIEDTVGVYAQNADAGAEVAFIYHAEKISVPKSVVTGAGEFEVGDKVYFDHADANVNNDSGSNYLCGICLKKPALSDTEVLIDLDGAAVTAS